MYLAENNLLNSEHIKQALDYEAKIFSCGIEYIKSSPYAEEKEYDIFYIQFWSDNAIKYTITRYLDTPEREELYEKFVAHAGGHVIESLFMTYTECERFYEEIFHEIKRSRH